MAYKFIDNYREKGARKRLVDILAKKGIDDERVLQAIGKVPRHYFFDETFWNQAYKDIAFPIGEGQTISQPYTVAYQTQLLHVNKNDKVLEIGVFSDLLYRLPISEAAPFFDYQGTQRHAQRLGYCTDHPRERDRHNPVRSVPRV